MPLSSVGESWCTLLITSTQVQQATVPVFFYAQLLDFVLDSLSRCFQDDTLQKKEVVLVEDFPVLEWADNLRKKKKGKKCAKEFPEFRLGNSLF